MLPVKENKAKATYIGLKLNKRTDADILDAIGNERELRQREIKRLVRIGIKELEALEKERNE